MGGNNSSEEGRKRSRCLWALTALSMALVLGSVGACNKRPVAEKPSESTTPGAAGRAALEQLISRLRTEPSESWETPYGQAGHELIAIGEEAVSDLVPLLGEAPEVAEKAASVLADMGSPAIRRMAELLKTEKDTRLLAGMLDVCGSVARSMAQLEELVARHLTSPDVEVRRKAARFFRDIRPTGKEVIQALERSRNDPDELTRRHVEKSLEGPGG